MRRATPKQAAPRIGQAISIHALLAESDQHCPAPPTSARVISIHALLAESDAAMGKPTLEIAYFYPRSPCGERLEGNNQYICKAGISIHALLAESDSKPRRLKSRRCVFLSTLSLRRATSTFAVTEIMEVISIHALLAESDQAANGLANAPPEISIHALLAESDQILIC